MIQRRRVVLLISVAAVAVIVAFATFSAFGSPAFASPTAQGGELTAAQWTEDATQLASELERRHASLYHSVSRDEFQAAAKAIIDSIPRMKAHQVIVAFARLTAMAYDGHTEMQPLQPAAGFHRVPVSLYLFEDTLYVTAADDANIGLLGARVDSIGQLPAREAYRRATQLVSRDNDEEYRYMAPAQLSSPEVLAALGASQALGGVEMALTMPDGARQHVSIAAGPAGVRPPVTRLADRARSGPPLSYAHPERNYWFQLLPESRTMFVEVRAIQNQSGQPSLAAFAKELFGAIDKDAPERVVFDLRSNTGGNNRLNKAFLDAIADRPRLQEKGRLFVLVGRTTFSAAMDLVLGLQRTAGAITVGESPRGAPFEGGNRESFTLKNSKLTVDYSQQLAPQFSTDAARTLPVDIAAPPTIAGARDGIDPALAAVLAYRRP
jgi:hypothetical protein